MKKFILSVAVPALMLMAAPAFAQSAADNNAATMQPSGGKSDQSLSAGTAGIQGSQTGAAYMNGKNGDGSASNSSDSNSMGSGSSMAMSNPSVSANSQLSASADNSPTYQGGRHAYRGKSESSLNKSESQITAQLNQQQSSQ